MTDAPQKGKTENPAQDEATQKLLSSLGDRVAQSPYNKVAPAFQTGLDQQKEGVQQGKGRDGYYTPPVGGEQPSRGRYGPDGTLYPGADQNKGNGNGTAQVPDFRKQHEGKQVDPTKPYERNPIGGQAANELKGGKPAADRQYSWQGGDFFDPRVQQTINKRGQHTDLMMAMGFGAAATVPIPMIHRGISNAADRAVIKAGENPTTASKLGKWWQSNADPAKASAADLIKPNAVHEAAFTDFKAMRDKLAQEVAEKGEFAAKAEEKLAFLEERSKSGLKTSTHLEAKVQGIFTDDELRILEKRITAEAATDAVSKRQAGRLAGLVENSPSWMKRMGIGLGGTLLDYQAITTDRAITRQFAGDKGVHESWNVSQLATPMAFAAMPGKWKLAAPVVGIISSQVVDGVARTTGLTAPDRWNAATGVFDGWNGAFVAGSLTLASYAKNPWAKATIAGLGTIVPTAMHLYQDNIGGNLKGKTDNARESVQEDHSERSYSSLKHVDSAMGKVLDKKEDWVAANVDASFAAMRAKWDKLGAEQRLLALRDDASTTGALSRNILDKGTRISDKGTEPEYMLQGYQLDVGGRALHYMLRTRNSADKAAQLTQGIINDNQNNPDKPITIKGEMPKKDEVDDLKKFSAEAQTDISKILDGKHDVRGAFDELVHKAEVLDKEFLKTYIKAPDRLILYYNEKGAKAKEVSERAASEGNDALRQQADAKMEEYAKVVGKLYRDQALAYMAMAAAKNKNGKDGGGSYDLLVDDGTNHKDIFETTGQRKGFNGAQGAMKMAENYSPTNPDMVELDKIFAETAAKMQENKVLQLTGGTNILGYHDNFARPRQ